MNKDQNKKNLNIYLIREQIKAVMRERMGRGLSPVPPKKQARILWKYPGAVERFYAKELKALMRQLTVPGTAGAVLKVPEWTREVSQQTKGDRTDTWDEELAAYINALTGLQTEIFTENKDEIIAGIVAIGLLVSIANNKEWSKNINWATGVKIVPAHFLPEPWLESAIRAWAQQNYTLIKSLSDEYIKKLNLSVSEGLLAGKSSKDILAEVRKLAKHLSKARTKLIARDQIGKLNGYITQHRQQDLGIEMYEWLTSADERVVGTPGGTYPRGTTAHRNHYKMNHTINKWEDPSVWSLNKGKSFQKRPANVAQLHPGLEIQCRCTGIAFFDELFEELEAEIKEESA